jgi:hypothetical protein
MLSDSARTKRVLAIGRKVPVNRSVVHRISPIIPNLQAVAEILALAIVRYHLRRRRPAPMSAETSCNAENEGIGVREGVSP